jgi:hypothetical protein
MTKVLVFLLGAVLFAAPTQACQLDHEWRTMNGDRWGFGQDGFVKPGDCQDELPQPQPYQPQPQIEPQTEPLPYDQPRY